LPAPVLNRNSLAVFVGRGFNRDMENGKINAALAAEAL
jgi:hypothetical protein